STARPAGAASQARTAKANPRPDAAAPNRKSQPAESPAGERPARRPAASSVESRLGGAREANRRAEDRAYGAQKKGGLAALPEWARLGLVALVFLVLLGGVMKIITSSGTREDRTVIRPIVSNTETPSPDETDVQHVAVNAATEDPGATASPTEGSTVGAADPTAEPQDWNSVIATNAPVIPEGDLRRATIRMAGDVIIEWEMLQDSYNAVMDIYDFSPYLSMIGTTLSSADYTMINIDASLKRGKYGYSGYPQFTTPPVILQALKNAGVDMITMCNNHMLDGYCDGVVEAVGLIERAGLDHIGGFVDEEDSKEPEIYEINGIRVGFVTYTQTTNSVETHCDDRYKFMVKYIKKAKFAEDIAAARAAGAEVVVAVTHWGEEYKRAPEAATVNYAKELVAAGADVIIGGHPHMVQPAEYLSVTDASGRTRTALCVYSLGNFLSQHEVRYTDSGIVFEFTIQENTDGSFSIVQPGYVPVYAWKWPVTDYEGNPVKSARDDRKKNTVYEVRVLPIAPYMETPPEGMDEEQHNRLRECWFETLEVMGGNNVLQILGE
ncbi:MAG: CapA family protein, partial [Clostridia bacterium]|nr:CapA family protein [Clostridia bacterium]